MRLDASAPGFTGIVVITAAILAVSVAITIVTDTYGHWPCVLLGIVVGLMAADSVDR